MTALRGLARLFAQNTWVPGLIGALEAKTRQRLGSALS